MGATTKLSVSELTVTPGGEAVVDVLVENTGSVVDEFAVEALGDAAIWAESTPPSVRLLPGGTATARVAFRPPREAGTSAGVVPFAVRVSSTEDPEGTVVEEGVLTIEAFADASADLLPTAAHGRRRARYHVAVDNRGNTALNAEIVPADPTGELKFKVRPAAVEVEPDTAAFSELIVVPRRTFWRGAAKPRPFNVRVNRPNEPPFPLNGTMLQEALLPSWAGLLALALIAALAGAAVLWSGVLSPAIQSTAKRAAETAVAAPLKQQADTVKQQGEAVKQQGAAIQKQDAAIKGADAALEKLGVKPDASLTGGASPGAAGSGSGGSSSGSTGASNGTSGTGTAGSLGAPFDARLDSKNANLPVQNGTLSLTDIFFENVNNDTGQISLARDTGDGSGFHDLKLERLDNFRDLDLHFVSPITLTKGQSLRLVLDKCQKGQGSSASGCSASVYLTGYLKS
jgi:hypothetical protein